MHLQYPPETLMKRGENKVPNYRIIYLFLPDIVSCRKTELFGTHEVRGVLKVIIHQCTS